MSRERLGEGGTPGSGTAVLATRHGDTRIHGGHEAVPLPRNHVWTSMDAEGDQAAHRRRLIAPVRTGGAALDKHRAGTPWKCVPVWTP